MKRPYHAIEDASPWRARRVGGLALAALLNSILAYALFTGLATRIVERIPEVIHARVVPQQQPQQRMLPPPSPELQRPSVPQVPAPVIRIRMPPAQSNAIHAMAVPHPARPVPPPAPAPQPASAVAGTHTIPPYPPISRRLGEEGTVLLRLTVATNGRVTGAQVLRSSGSARLDEAARDWVVSHWRYHPATRNGAPVESSVEAAVKFDLRDGP